MRRQARRSGWLNRTPQTRLSAEPPSWRAIARLTAAVSMAAVMSAIAWLEIAHGPAQGLSAQVRTATRPGQEHGR